MGPGYNDAAVIQGGMSLVPNLRDQLIQDSLLKMQQTEFANAQADRAAQQAAAAKTEQQAAAFQADLEDALLTGDPRKIIALRMRHPEFAKGMKDAFDAMDEAERRRNLTQIGTIYQRAQSGDATGAAAILRQRIEADKAAGMADPQDEAILAELESGDANRVRTATGVIGIQLAAIEPDKFGETYGKLNPSEAKTAEERQYEFDVRTFGKAYADQAKIARDSKTLAVQPGGRIDVFGPDPSLIGGMGGQQGSAPAAQGGGDPSGSGVRGPELGKAIESTALATVPGLTVTSRKRSAEKNKSVGGAANSFHLTDEARDFVPPKGMSMGALASQLKAAMPGFDVINEGDHVHVEPSSRSGIKQVRSVQEARALPVGTVFMTPDGRLKRR